MLSLRWPETGEDSDHWEAFQYPMGDTRASLNAFVALVEGAAPLGVEQWEAGLLEPATSRGPGM